MLRLAEGLLTVHVGHEGVCEALELVPKRSGNLKVSQLGGNVALLHT